MALLLLRMHACAYGVLLEWASETSILLPLIVAGGYDPLNVENVKYLAKFYAGLLTRSLADITQVFFFWHFLAFPAGAP